MKIVLVILSLAAMSLFSEMRGSGGLSEGAFTLPEQCASIAQVSKALGCACVVGYVGWWFIEQATLVDPH